MYCPKCGWKNADDAVKCANCFAALGAGQPQPTQQMPSQPPPPPPAQPYAQPPPQQPYSQQPYSREPYGYQYQPGMTPSVPDYLVWSILVTVFCCVPLGIVAIVKSASANSKKAAGDYYGALQEANAAKTWLWWGFGVGLAGNLLAVALCFLGALAG